MFTLCQVIMGTQGKNERKTQGCRLCEEKIVGFNRKGQAGSFYPLQKAYLALAVLPSCCRAGEGAPCTLCTVTALPARPGLAGLTHPAWRPARGTSSSLHGMQAHSSL